MDATFANGGHLVGVQVASPLCEHGDLRLLDSGYNFCYTRAMKTAISIPDSLFEAAEQFAHANGLSRSELFARAIQLYLQTFHAHGITAALNQVYADEPSTLDPALAAAQTRALPKEDW